MTKKEYINQCMRIGKSFKKQINEEVPAVYASVALALHDEFGWGFERINRLFTSSQNIWSNHSGDVSAMIKLCEEKTGIAMRDNNNL